MCECYIQLFQVTRTLKGVPVISGHITVCLSEFIKLNFVMLIAI